MSRCGVNVWPVVSNLEALVGLLVKFPLVVSISSPTVACLRSSKKVQKPSLKSPTNCLPASSKGSLGAPLTNFRGLGDAGAFEDGFKAFDSLGTVLDRTGPSMVPRRVFDGAEVSVAFPRLPAEAVGDSSDKVFVWREPEKTVRWG